MATRQGGVIARRQLLELGYGRGWIDGRLSTRYLQPLYPGVYIVGHAAIGYRGRWMGAILAGGPGSVASHKVAAAIWDLRPFNSGRIDVTVPVTRHRIEGVRLHRSRSLRPDEVTVHDDFAVTTVERTLIDLGATLTYAEHERAFEQAIRLRLLDMRKLRLTPGRKGVAQLRQIVATHAPAALDTRSELERCFLAFVAQNDLPQPAVNVEAAGYEVDCLWPAHNLIVELDGYATHGDRRSAFENDHVKTATLQLAGYTVIRMTWWMLHNEPGRIKALLQAQFGRQAEALARR